MFRDLDEVFFGGRLHDRVTLQWFDLINTGRLDNSELARDATAYTDPGENSHECQSDTSHIHLNAMNIFDTREDNPFRRMWSAVIHEMW